MSEEPVDFQSELLRLRNEVQALAQANVHAAQLMAELQEARVLEELLKANNQELQKAKRLEEARAHFLELVARNQPEEALIAGIADLIRSQHPDLPFAIFLSKADDMRQAHSDGFTDPLKAALEGIPLSTAACVRKAMLARKPLVVAELGEAPNSGAVCQLLRSHGFGMLSCTPVMSPTGRAFGALCALGLAPGELDAALHLLDQAANLLAMGLHHRTLTERLTFQAHHDTLTSLPNRTFFYEALHDALEGAKLTDKKIAILWMDLDRFKQINDTLGHHTADLILQMVGHRLRECVGRSWVIARMGGDEFAILMNSVSTAEQATALAEALLSVFREPFGLGEHQVTIGLSVGISIFPDHGDDSEELVRNADLAMYSAKHAGRNTYACFMLENATRSMETVRIEFHLRRALELGELELYFQPLVSCADGKIKAFETLLRWFCPALGAVSPAQFIPVAEAAGLMPVIGQWVLEQACLQAARWQQTGPGVRVAVNVAAQQLARGDFKAVVADALTRSQLSPSLLELELTESAVMDTANCQQWIADLRQLGVSLAIDDFGTGYSSLSYLHHLDVDKLKVDRSFVQALGKEPGSAKLAETIISMAKSLGLQVVAEGIETQEQMDWLVNLGCDLLQGYYLHRPMPVAAVGELLARQELKSPASTAI